jgi:Ca2+-binding EF-hand superfamily protein
MKLNYLKTHLKNDQTCKELFDACDEDKDGCLSRGEFINLSKALGADLTMNEIDHSMAILDPEEAGAITFDNFMAWWRAN